MLTNVVELLKSTNKAVPQFNINNLEWTKYILETCQELNNPVILGISEKTVDYMGGYITVVNLVVGLMIDLKINIPVSLHLDHGTSYENCKTAIDAGFTSIMIDGSKLSLEDNIMLTSKVVEYASKYKVSVEGELGVIGDEQNNETLDDYKLFISATGIDLLAPSVGNCHGVYKEKPNLNYDKIRELSKLNIPLVLHGGSGLDEEIINKLIDSGITKININTDLQIEWANGLRKYIDENKDIYDPRKIISSGKENMKTKIKDIILAINTNK